MRRLENRYILPFLPGLLALVVAPLIAQPSPRTAAPRADAARPEPVPLADFDAYTTKAVADWEVPGLAVAVLQDGEVVFAKGYGVRSLGGEKAVDTETLFAIGSTTKAMTAVAVGMLVDEGKLAWDDPVIRHLPDYQLKDPYVTREITLRDLLAHRTGVGNSDFLWYEQENTTAEILKAMRHIDQAASLRSTFIYQNVMYTAAGEIVATVSGMSWADFVRRRIFEPLGMNGALATAASLADQPNVASPHDRVDGVVTVIENASVDPVAPAGSVWAGVGDMARWMRFLLAGGVTESGQRLLSEAVHRELFAPQTVIRQEIYPTARLTRPHWTTYGLAWFQADYQGQAVDFHTGSIDGMVAIAGMIRDQGLGVYVLGNLDHAEVRHALMYRAFDLFGQARMKPGESRDWSAEFLELYGSLREQAEQAEKKQEEARVADAPPSLPLERYVGHYEHEAYGHVEITANGDGLRMRFGRLTGLLEPWHYETFKMRFDTAWRGALMVTFRLDAQGNPAVMNLGIAEFRRTASLPSAAQEPEIEKEHHDHHGSGHHKAGHHGAAHDDAQGFHHDFSDAERWSERFDSPDRQAWQQPSEVARLMEIEPGMTLVDLGAGTGYFLSYLSRATGETGRVLALDVEESLVQFIAKRAENEDWDNVEARRIPFDDPQLEDASVDRILIVNTWHHIDNRGAYSAKLNQALKPDGRVYVVDLTADSPSGPPPEHRISEQQLIRELGEGGLTAEIVPEQLVRQFIVMGRTAGRPPGRR